jgi:hypothetical protein
MRFTRFSILGLVFVLAPIACSIQTTDDSKKPVNGTGINSVSIIKTSAGGDFHMSGRLGVDAGKLGITLAAIRDPDATSKPADPSKVTFSVTLGTKDLTCTVGKVSSSSKSSVDLVFINDTTGSMSGTVLGIADSVESFASSISSEGVDARFSMYTYGDAFATKKTDGTSTFKIGLGDFAPPTFDGEERPYVGLSELTQFKGFLQELKSSDVLGVGGGDGEEATVGALAYADGKLAFRDGAARMYVAIGDNPSHQKGDGTNETFTPSWVAPGGDELVKKLDGNAAVHVIGHDLPSSTDTTSKFYNLKKLADGTGGAFIDLPSDGKVDLGALNLKQWLISSFNGSCTDATTGTVVVTIKATLKGTKDYVGTLTFDAEIK